MSTAIDPIQTEQHPLVRGCSVHPAEQLPCKRCSDWRLRRRVRLERRRICISCAASPMVAGRVHCKTCLNRFAKKAKRDAAQRADGGQCITGGCKHRAAPDHRLCGRHLEDMRAAAKARRQRQLARGWCTNSCGRRIEFPPHQTCITCEASRRLRAGRHPLPEYIRRLIKAGFKQYRAEEARAFLRSYLRLVSDLERQVISLVYGLGEDGQRHNLTAAGAEMGFSRERARQVHDKAMLRIFAVPVETPVALLPTKKKLNKYPRRLNERIRAREIAQRAIKAGRLLRQPCNQCGADRAEAHHTDYSRPLDVTWLCGKCHRAAHRQERVA